MVCTIPHKSSINRVRSLAGAPIIALWNEKGEVVVYDVSKQVKYLSECD